MYRFIGSSGRPPHKYIFDANPYMPTNEYINQNLELETLFFIQMHCKKARLVETYEDVQKMISYFVSKNEKQAQHMQA